MNHETSGSSPATGSVRTSRPDSGIAHVELRKSMDKSIASNTCSKRASNSVHGSRRSSRSSQHPSISYTTGNMSRHQRPAHHSYKSSAGSQRACTTEELNALYARSCAIMRSGSTPNGDMPDKPPQPSLNSGRSSIRSQPTSFASDPLITFPSCTIPQDKRLDSKTPTFANPWAPTPPESFEAEVPSVEPIPIEVIAPNTTHWLSPETRARQYAEIERSCKGWRGFWKRATRNEKKAKLTQDHCVDFYDEKNGDDGASVRRYRIDVENEDEKKDDCIEIEKMGGEKRERRRRGWLGGR